jgi:nicotinamidase/pyrazinamidase
MSKINQTPIASLDVDPQKGFTVLCPDELPVIGGDTIVPVLNAIASIVDIRTVSRDLHPAEALWNAATPDEMLQPVGLKNVDIKWNPHCRVGTYGAELLDGLPHPIEGYDFCANKGMDADSHPYGACYHDLGGELSTGLIEYYHSKGVKRVVVGGLATDFCVKISVLQLLQAGFSVALVKSATFAALPELYDTAIEEMRSAGAIIFETVPTREELEEALI